MHHLKLPILAIFSVWFSDIKYIPAVVQPSAPAASEALSWSPTETVPIKHELLALLNPRRPSLQPLAITILFSVSMNLTLLGTSYQWGHTRFVLLCLAYFPSHNVFKVHPYCSLHLNFIPF